MVVLGIDIGNTTGFAIASQKGIIAVWSERNRVSPMAPGARWAHFWDHLVSAHTATRRQSDGVEYFAHEIVYRHRGTTAAHVYGGYLATVELYCHRKEIPASMPVAVQKVKIRLTGKGNASKSEMMTAASKLVGRDLNEHEADACGVALCAYDQIASSGRLPA